MSSSNCLQVTLANLWSQSDMKDVVRREPGAADKNRQHQQWQINLLDHIDAVQDDVSHRMDFIERELDGELSMSMLFCLALQVDGKLKIVKGVLVIFSLLI